MDKNQREGPRRHNLAGRYIAALEVLGGRILDAINLLIHMRRSAIGPVSMLVRRPSSGVVCRALQPTSKRVDIQARAICIYIFFPILQKITEILLFESEYLLSIIYNNHLSIIYT